jgi:hypothetical protein
MIVSGPFGITAAKFLGTDKEFHFINVLENERYNGKPDSKTLEMLTGMRGLSLGLLNDLIYGVSPIRLNDRQVQDAKQQIMEKGMQRIVVNNPQGFTEAITLRPNIKSLRLYTYRRWNRQLDTSQLELYRPDLLVTFSGTIAEDPFLLPMTITASSGLQTLEIEYSLAKENPNELTVKIKMPQ